MAFRGIGDAATEVIKSQNQLAMQGAQLSEAARQFDARVSQQKAERAEAARQFDARVSQQKAERAETARQFDVTGRQRQASQAESARQFDAEMAQKEAGRAEQTRQFEVANARESAQQDWRMRMDELSASLNAMSTESSLMTQDANRQMLTAQLAQYNQATETERRQMANREQSAKAGFYGLWLSALTNGGVSASAANALMKQQLGLKTGGVYSTVDLDTGVLRTFITGDDGQETVKETPAALFYQNYAADMGDEAAKPLYNYWSGNRAVQAQMTAAKSKAAADLAQKQAQQRDPLRMSENFSKAAERERKLMFEDIPNRAQHEANAKKYEDAASQLSDALLAEATGGRQTQQKAAKPEESYLTAEERSALGVPYEHIVISDPDGSLVVTYFEGGRLVRRRLTPSQTNPSAPGMTGSPAGETAAALQKTSTRTESVSSKLTEEDVSSMSVFSDADLKNIISHLKDDESSQSVYLKTVASELLKLRRGR